MKAYTETELRSMNMRELVSIYNFLEDAKEVKRFGTLNDGVKRILKFQKYSMNKNIKEQNSRSGRVSSLIKDNNDLTNREFTKIKGFIKLCKKADTEPTLRQASKFRNFRGLAYLAA